MEMAVALELEPFPSWERRRLRPEDSWGNAFDEEALGTFARQRLWEEELPAEI